MCTTRCWLVGLGLAILLVPSAAPAQPTPANAPATTFSALAPMLAALQGSTLLVTDTNGRTTKERITSLTADALELATHDRTLTFEPRDIVEVGRCRTPVVVVDRGWDTGSTAAASPVAFDSCSA